MLTGYIAYDMQSRTHLALGKNARRPSLQSTSSPLHPWRHCSVTSTRACSHYEERHREQQVQLLKKRAAKLGLQLVGPEVP